MSNRVLLIEDDDKLGRQLVQTLAGAGFDVTWINRGDTAIGQGFDACDLIVLDLMLPGAHGFDVLKTAREARSQNSHVPILVLSARPDTSDKVRAFELGADDYLTKPFWPEELLARVRARLRRPVLATSGPVTVGGLSVDIEARTVAVGDGLIDVTRAEFEFLAALARRPGAAVSRAWLAEHVLDPGRDADERTLDVHVSRLRKKLGVAAGAVVTVWGIGYRLKVDA